MRKIKDIMKRSNNPLFKIQRYEIMGENQQNERMGNPPS